MKTHSSFRLSFLLQLWGWLSRYGSWVLRGCALPYAFIARLKRTCYQRGWRRQYRLPHPVVSVGNLTVGGTGKTPFVIWLARQIHAQGRRVAILSRGYGRQKALQNMIVSDGESLKADWQLAGDEPVLIAQHCPWAIVAVGKDRYRSFAIVQQHRGVTARNLQWIDQLLGVQHSPSASHVMNRSSQVESKEFSTEGSHS